MPQLLIQHKIGFLSGGLLSVLVLGSVLYLNQKRAYLSHLDETSYVARVSSDVAAFFCHYNNLSHLVGAKVHDQLGTEFSKAESNQKRSARYDYEHEIVVPMLAALQATVAPEARPPVAEATGEVLDKLQETLLEFEAYFLKIENQEFKKPYPSVAESNRLQNLIYDYYDALVDTTSDPNLHKSMLGMRAFLTIKRELWRVRGSVSPITFDTKGAEHPIVWSRISSFNQRYSTFLQARQVCFSVAGPQVERHIRKFFDAEEVHLYLEVAQKIVDLKLSPKTTQQEFLDAHASFDPYSEGLRAGFYALSDHAVAATRELSEDLLATLDGYAAQARSETYWATGLIVFVIAIAIYLSRHFARSIARSIRQVNARLSGSAATGLAAARQLAESSQGLAEDASSDASSIEEFEKTVAHISSISEQNEKALKSASDIVDRAKQSADLGSHSMEELTLAMTSIDSSSREIEQIIQSIEEIAFQTNILALNAAVEAARAGEAGAGFAVVADEVRALAHRSSAAAADTTQKISKALEHSEAGRRISEEAQTRFGSMVSDTEEFRTIINEINHSVSSQNAGIDEMNTTMRFMSERTHRVASVAEQNSAHAKELTFMTKDIQKSSSDLDRQVSKKGRDASPSHR